MHLIKRISILWILSVLEVMPRYLGKPWLKYRGECSHGNLGNVYNHTRFGYRIQEDSVCRGEIFLLAFVHTDVHHFERRAAVRETWGSLQMIGLHRVRVAFILGLPTDQSNTQNKVLTESAAFRDIVQGNFIDDYRNLTYKHLLALDWLIRHCSQAKFVSKSDDDTLLNTPKIVNFLVNVLHKRSFGVQKSRPFIYGQTIPVGGPLRNPASKWFVTEEEWSGDSYPVYCKGFGYIISGDAVKPLLYCSYWVRYFWIDDVFVSGQLAKYTDIPRVSMWAGYAYAWIMGHHADSKDANDYLFFVGRYNEFDRHVWRGVWRTLLENM